MRKQLLKKIATAIALLFAPAWISTAAWAQTTAATTIVVNGAAPAAQRPNVTRTASGVMQVDIESPRVY